MTVVPSTLPINPPTTPGLEFFVDVTVDLEKFMSMLPLLTDPQSKLVFDALHPPKQVPTQCSYMIQEMRIGDIAQTIVASFSVLLRNRCAIIDG